MWITKPGIFALLLMPCACAPAAGHADSQTPSQGPLRGAVAEFHVTLYDGRMLEGRFLIGATDYDPLPVNAQLNMFDDVLIEKVRACGTTKILPFRDRGPRWEAARRGRVKRIVTLEKDEWHGANVFFPLFDSMWPWPDCFETDLRVLAADGRVLLILPVRIERTDKPPATPDGGVPKPAAPAPPTSPAPAAPDKRAP